MKIDRDTPYWLLWLATIGLVVVLFTVARWLDKLIMG